VKVFLIYVGVIISGGILIALGFWIMGASFFDSTDSFEWFFRGNHVRVRDVRGIRDCTGRIPLDIFWWIRHLYQVAGWRRQRVGIGEFLPDQWIDKKPCSGDPPRSKAAGPAYPRFDRGL